MSTLDQVRHHAVGMNRITSSELFSILEAGEDGDFAQMESLSLSLRNRIFMIIMYALQRASEDTKP